MQLRLMTEAEIERWYSDELSEAFPPNERKPLAEIRRLISAGYYDVFGLYEGAALVGYAAIMKRPEADYVLLDYLGVTATRRNGGLGGEVLCHLRGQYMDRLGLITEAECPVPDDSEAENDLRRRRIGFYVRCGFTPVYEMASCGVRFQALLLGEAPVNLAPVMADHRAIYGPLRTDVKVPLGPSEVPELPYWMKEETT